MTSAMRCSVDIAAYGIPWAALVPAALLTRGAAVVTAARLRTLAHLARLCNIAHALSAWLLRVDRISNGRDTKADRIEAFYIRFLSSDSLALQQT